MLQMLLEIIIVLLYHTCTSQVLSYTIHRVYTKADTYSYVHS